MVLLLGEAAHATSLHSLSSSLISQVATFYLYLRFITNNLLVEITSTEAMAKLFATAIKRHVLISYGLYCAGFVAFVLSLKRGLYRYQFSQYGWTHMIILVVIMPTSFFVSNTFSGIIW
jgi:phosphatidate cytidylyltransferase